MSADDELIRQAWQETPRAEPGAQLDARILQAAHAAVQKPQRATQRWSWLTLPLSAAAVAILATTVVLHSQRTPAPQPQISSAPQAPTQTAQADAAPAASAPPAASPTVVAPTVAEKPARKAQAPLASAAEQVAAERQVILQKDVAQQTERVREEMKIAAAPFSRSAAPSPSKADQAFAEKVPSVLGSTAPSTVPSTPAPVAAAPRPEPQAGTSVADAGPRAFLAPAAPPEQRDTLSKQAESTGLLMKPKAAAKAEARSAAPSEAQLEAIRKLLREDKTEEAKKAIRELQKQYPGFELPKAWRALIEPPAQ